MNKKYSIVLACILLLGSVSAQIPCSSDNTFNSNGTLVSDGNCIGERIAVLADGSAVVAYNPFNSGHVYLRHLNNDGSIDNSFGTNGKTTIQVSTLRTDVNAIWVQGNDLYLCGNSGNGSSIYAYVAKLQSNGLLDVTFGNAGIASFTSFYTFNDLHIHANQILLAGMKSVNKASLIKLNMNGTLDLSFGNGGSTDIATTSSTTYYSIDDVHIDQLQRFLITGKYYATASTNTFTQVVVMRFNSNGLLDNSFDSDGIAYFNSQLNGSHEEGRKIFSNSANEYFICAASHISSSNWNYALLKINEDGSRQNSFGTNGWKIYDLAQQGKSETLLNAEMMSNGNILLTGNEGSGDTIHFAMLMVKPDGSVDQNFAPNGLYRNIFGANNNSSSAGLALTSDGKIYLSGYTRTCSGGTCGNIYLAVARYQGGYAPNSVSETNVVDLAMLYPNPISPDGQFTIASNHQSTVLSIRVVNGLGEPVPVLSLGTNQKKSKWQIYATNEISELPHISMPVRRPQQNVFYITPV
jgi:uncharacterized delta-60 repeat protein